MSRAEPSPATLLLKRIAAGDALAADELYSLVYDELHRIARAHMRQQDSAHTLQATALINEAWLRLSPNDGTRWEGREHFLSVASRAMRTALIDHARRRAALKRGGAHERMPLDTVVEYHEERNVDLIALDDALSRLAALDERQARIVELHTFGGLTMPEAAEVLGVSLATAERGMRAARAWLKAELSA